MAGKKKQPAATETPMQPEVGSFAQAVMDGRTLGSKASQKDWVRLVQAHYKREFVPMSLVDEVFEAAGYNGDAYTHLLDDAKALAGWLRSQRAGGSDHEDLQAKHGSREDLEAQHKALKEELENVANLLKEYDQAFHYDAVVHKKAQATQRTNKRLFPGGATSLLQEAGIV